MKLRFSENHLIFRITNQEYLVLLDKGSISTCFIFPNNDELIYKLSLGNESVANIKYNTIELIVTSEQIKDLKLVPQKTGIENKYETINGEMTISLEIDLMKC